MTYEASRLNLPRLKSYYEGKVRQVYHFDNDMLAIVATDRVSAFDHILPRPIPGKGAVLNLLSAYFLEQTRSIAPNWLVKTVHPRVSIGHYAEPVRVEMVVRGHLCGHALRQYQKGARMLCGEPMPEGLKPYQAFPKPIITPTTKADEGHDTDISRQEILAQKLVPEKAYAQMEQYSLALFDAGRRHAAGRGLVLADTKYEFGLKDGQVMLIDEIHTPDSSRYYHAEGYGQLVDKGETPRQLSKEFVREWLMSQGFMGREGDAMPTIDADRVAAIAERYEQLYTLLTGQVLDTQGIDDEAETLQKAITEGLGLWNFAEYGQHGRHKRLT